MKQFSRLIRIMKRLRDPKKGCPWDLRQTEQSLQEYVLEESHELVEAIESGSVSAQREELGDLLLQIVFLSRIHEEKGHFSIQDVINTISSKLISRHPHIFSDLKLDSPQDVRANWEKIKKREKKKSSILSDQPIRLPALLAAKRIGEQAASVGFDWQDASPTHSAPLQALEKVREEVAELERVMTDRAPEDPGHRGRESRDQTEAMTEEIGDILFSVSNVSRLLDINPEIALRSAIRKFASRFRYMEDQLKKMGKDLHETTFEEMEALWEHAKAAIKTPK